MRFRAFSVPRLFLLYASAAMLCVLVSASICYRLEFTEREVRKERFLANATTLALLIKQQTLLLGEDQDSALRGLVDKQATLADVDVYIVETDDKGARSFLYESSDRTARAIANLKAARDEGVRWTSEIRVRSKDWSIVIVPRDQFFAARNSVMSVLIFALGANVAILLLLVGRSRISVPELGSGQILKGFLSRRGRADGEVAGIDQPTAFVLNPESAAVGKAERELSEIANPIPQPKRAVDKEYTTKPIAGEFRIRQVLRDIESELVPELEEKELTFVHHVAENVPHGLRGDTAKLREIFLGLIKNSISSCFARGAVVIQVRQEKLGSRNVKLGISISGTGQGIPEEVQGRMFDHSNPASNIRNEQLEGRWKNLSHIAQIVHVLGGTIAAKSIPYRGASFYIQLYFPILWERRSSEIPRETLEAVRELVEERLEIEGENHPQPPEKRMIRRLNILLAQDDTAKCRVTKKMLERLGHEVEVVAFGIEAVELAKKGSFDLVLIDMKLPDFDALEASSRIRDSEKKSGARVAIVAMADESGEEAMERAKEAGVDSVLPRPFNKRELFEVIGRHVTLLSEGGKDSEATAQDRASIA